MNGREPPDGKEPRDGLEWPEVALLVAGAAATAVCIAVAAGWLIAVLV